MSASQDVCVLTTHGDPGCVQPMEPARLARLVRLSRSWPLLIDSEMREFCALAEEASVAHDRLLEAARTLLVTGDAWRVEAERLAVDLDHYQAAQWSQTAGRLKGEL